MGFLIQALSFVMVGVLLATVGLERWESSGVVGVIELMFTSLGIITLAAFIIGRTITEPASKKQRQEEYLKSLSGLNKDDK